MEMPLQTAPVKDLDQVTAVLERMEVMEVMVLGMAPAREMLLETAPVTDLVIVLNWIYNLKRGLHGPLFMQKPIYHFYYKGQLNVTLKGTL